MGHAYADIDPLCKILKKTPFFTKKFKNQEKKKNLAKKDLKESIVGKT